MEVRGNPIDTNLLTHRPVSLVLSLHAPPERYAHATHLVDPEACLLGPEPAIAGGGYDLGVVDELLLVVLKPLTPHLGLQQGQGGKGRTGREGPGQGGLFGSGSTGCAPVIAGPLQEGTPQQDFMQAIKHVRSPETQWPFCWHAVAR